MFRSVPLCGNCQVPLVDETCIKSLVSTWGEDNTVSIYEALSVIFEILPLADEEVKKNVFKEGSRFMGGEGKGASEWEGFGLCIKCSEVLTTLYNSFLDFISLCKLEGDVGRILKALEEKAQEVVASSRRNVIKTEPVEESNESGPSGGEEEDIDNNGTNQLPDDFDEPNFIVNSPQFSPAVSFDDGDCDDDGNGIEDQKPEIFIRPGPKRKKAELLQRIKFGKARAGADDKEEFINDSRAPSNSNQRHQCMICKERFLLETTLICHRRIIHHEKIISLPQLPHPRGSAAGTSTCPICRMNVPRSEIKEHLSLHTRSVQKPWLCTFCSKEFVSQTALSRHSQTHKINAPCRHCGKQFPILEVLSHTRACSVNSRGEKGPNVMWSCKLCGVRFSRRNWMITHMTKHLQAKRFSCKICDKKFERSTMLQIHIKRFHRANDGAHHAKPEPTSSNFQEQGSSVKTALQQVERVNRFLCKGCSLTFPTTNELKTHLMESHANKETSTCTICERQFQDTFCLELHQKSHTEIKPIQCATCGKEYRDRYNFLYHLKEEHGMKNQAIVETYYDIFGTKAIRKNLLEGEILLRMRPPAPKGVYPCEVCGKVFHHTYSVEKHKRVVHDKVKDFICSYCGKSFARKSYFLIHERLHTSTERPYKCHLCGKGFRVPGNLKMHLTSTIHSTERNYVCETCGKRFNRRDNLRYHVRAVHLKVAVRKPRERFRETSRNNTTREEDYYMHQIPVPNLSDPLYQA